jgi:hypothetical protein
MTPLFSEPTDEQYAELARMWLSISQLVDEEYGYELDQSLDDLPYLQRVIDDDLIDKSNAYAARCIGFAFGRVIISNNDGFDWWVVNDEFAEKYIVRYRETSFQLDAMNIFLKRFEDSIDVAVAGMYDSILSSFAELRGSFD